MNEMDDLLQQRIEQLEAGEPLAVCLMGLPEEDAQAIRLIAAMQAEGDAEEYAPVKAAQRVVVLQVAAGLLHPATPPSPTRNLRLSFLAIWQQLLTPVQGKQWLPAGFAFVLVFAVLLAAWAGTSWWLSGNKDNVPMVADQAPTTLANQTDTQPTPFAESETASAGLLAPDAGATAVAAAAPNHTTFLPMMSVALALDAQTAVLQDMQGLVEVQGTDGSWTAVTQTTSLAGGQSLRTGPLSSVTLSFYDGSWTRIGPESELSIDTLNAPVPADGSRTIALTQLRGESQHDVVPREDDSSYVVDTPNGTGTVHGTQFQVVVQNASLVQFIVSQGEVEVSNQDVSVTVISGQGSTVVADQPPTEPYLFMSGEGEVAQIGENWVIAGQTFQTNADSHIVGNPQIGDLVRVEGSLLPDGRQLAIRIILLHRALANRFSFNGAVESIGNPVWVVAGQNVIVNAQTQIEAGVDVGDEVRVDGVIIQGGTLLAENIRLLEDAPGLPFQFVGIVQTMGENSWTVSGKTITLNSETAVSPGIANGDQVRVRGWITADDTWLASAIERLPQENPSFDFSGIVQTINPWQVSGIPFATRDWTTVDEGIIVGSRVRVSGPILPDGTWVASEIRLLDNLPGHQIVFVGRVNSTNPWVVSQIPLTVNAATHFIGDVQVGDLVQVRADVQPNGEWLARTIRKLSPPTSNIIIIIQGPIQAINGNILVVGGFTIRVAPDHPILGMLEEGDVVRVIGRLQSDGVVIALVIYTVIDGSSDEITVRVEGPIEAIEGNLVLVNGIWLWLDPANPILGLLQIGDFVSVEGYFGSHDGRVVLIVIHIIILDITIVEQDCYWHEGMGMGMGHWHCSMGMGMGMSVGMGMGMGNP